MPSTADTPLPAPALTVAEVQAHHRARLGWAEPAPAEARALARAWSASLPNTEPLLIQLALATHTDWPTPELLDQEIAGLLRTGALALPGRPATAEDLSAWPETVDRLKEPPPGLSAREEAALLQRRALDVEVWLRPIPVRLLRGVLVLDITRMGGALPQVLPALLTGGLPGLHLSWHLADLHRLAGCALALRFAAPARDQATA